ncbi:MAG TPA: DOPA 4,5-dioxygenase family protein [Candidatus Binataceae bacterium]|nr:DOPA 4,5-dioxygenase family protein [Candidatus Binataceae bacterium]
MDSPSAPVDAAAKITGYHAHIYYDEGTRATAAWLREQIERNFTVTMGRWREEPVGPHPQSMYQVAFESAEFARIVPWLMINRRGLVILVHPNTGDAYTDHATNALWLGEKLALRLDFLRNLDR